MKARRKFLFPLLNECLFSSIKHACNPCRVQNNLFIPLCLPCVDIIRGVVVINDRQKLLLSGDVVSQQVVEVLHCFREELDDHRLAINENTEELASNMDAINELASRLEKLTERVDELALLVKGSVQNVGFDIKPLSAREKEVFHALYELTESAPYTSYEQIARKCCIERDSVALSISSMVRKGVLIVKRMNGSSVMIRLDSAFREEQAKRNIVGLSSLLNYL